VREHAHDPEVVDPDEGKPVPAEPQEEEGQPLVTEPLKLVRIASMVQAMLMEVRSIKLDASATSRLQGVHYRTVEALKGIMSEELTEELDNMVLPLEGEASEAEVRVAQAQLAGWLEGLFHGIRASLWGQQIAVQKAAAQSLEALHALEARKARSGEQEDSGQGLYL
jgi:hypothetical protein